MGCLVPAQSVCARSWWGEISGRLCPLTHPSSQLLSFCGCECPALLCVQVERLLLHVIAHAIAGGSALALLLILVAVPGVGWVPLPGFEGGGCSHAAGEGGHERHILRLCALRSPRGGVVRVLMSGWQPLGPARPSRLGRCTSY